MGIDIDWEAMLDDIGDEDLSPVLIPEDTYDVKIESAKHGMTKSSGNEKIEVVFTITSGEYKGKKLYGRINFATGSKQSMLITVQQLGVVGISRNYLASNNPSVEQIAKKITGKACRVKIGHREYDGKTYTEVKRWEPAADEGDPF